MIVVRQDMRSVRSDPQARQPVGGERASIDVDPVVAQLGLPDGRVAVHDDEAEVAVVLQELAPDAEQVGRRLIFELGAGLDASVHGEIGAQTRIETGLLVEAQMLMRQVLAKAVPDGLRRNGEGEQARRDAVGQESGEPADGSPLRQAVTPAEKIQKQLLVVAPEEGSLNFAPTGNEPGNDSRRVRSPIDIVAQIHFQRTPGLEPGLVLVDALLRLDKQSARPWMSPTR